MAVGGNSVRLKPLIENFAGNIEIQIVQSVTYIHEHARFLGMPYLRPEFTIPIEQTAGMHGEHMRDDVPRPEVFENVTHMHWCSVFGPTFSNMDEQRQLQSVAQLSRSFQRLHPLGAEGTAGSHDLDADDDVAVRFHHSGDS